MGIVKTCLKRLYTFAKWTALVFWVMYADAKHFSFIGPTILTIGYSIACLAGETCDFSDVHYRAVGGGIFDDREWMKHRPDRTKKISRR